MASLCRDSRFTESPISDGTENDPFLTKMIHNIIALIHLRSPDTVITITITAITFSILNQFQISELAHRVGDQLSVGIINAKNLVEN